MRTRRRHGREERVAEERVKLLLAFPEWRTLAEPVVHARATHESERREPEDRAGTHIFFAFCAAVARAVEQSTRSAGEQAALLASTRRTDAFERMQFNAR